MDNLVNRNERLMLSSNPGTTGRVISWAMQHWFYF